MAKARKKKATSRKDPVRAASKKKASAKNGRGSSTRVNENGLTAKQQEFADLYRGDPECRGNATACYRRMHPRASDQTCEVQGHRTLRNPKVSAYLERKQREAEEAADVSQAQTLRELAGLSFSRLHEVFDERGWLRPPEEWPESLRVALSSVEVVTRPGAKIDENGNREIEYVHKLRLWDKNSALEKLMKHLGMFERDNSQQADPISRLLAAIDGQTKGLSGTGIQ